VRRGPRSANKLILKEHQAPYLLLGEIKRLIWARVDELHLGMLFKLLAPSWVDDFLFLIFKCFGAKITIFSLID
jgi:hypothetical protein